MLLAFTRLDLAVRLSRRITKPRGENEMAKIQKEAAISDLFDSSSNNKGIKPNSFGESLLALVQSGDEAGQQAWSNAAKAGQVMRIC